jgi:hypothetical protein
VTWLGDPRRGQFAWRVGGDDPKVPGSHAPRSHGSIGCQASVHEIVLCREGVLVESHRQTRVYRKRPVLIWYGVGVAASSPGLCPRRRDNLADPGEHHGRALTHSTSVYIIPLVFK